MIVCPCEKRQLFGTTYTVSVTAWGCCVWAAFSVGQRSLEATKTAAAQSWERTDTISGRRYKKWFKGRNCKFLLTDSAEYLRETVEETPFPGFISSVSLSHKFSRSVINSLKLMKPVLWPPTPCLPLVAMRPVLLHLWRHFQQDTHSEQHQRLFFVHTC